MRRYGVILLIRGLIRPIVSIEQSYPIPFLCFKKVLYIRYTWSAIIHIISQFVSSVKLTSIFPIQVANRLLELVRNCSPTLFPEFLIALDKNCPFSVYLLRGSLGWGVLHPLFQKNHIARIPSWPWYHQAVSDCHSLVQLPYILFLRLVRIVL